jgi:cell division inhibitor SepF
MALRDSWHSALVYFGLAEERDARVDDYDDDPAPREPEEELEDRYRERQQVRRLSSRRRRDEIDDIFADDDEPARRPTTRLRTVNGAGDVRVHLVIPKRLIDFASGLTYALDGGMQRIADKVFMLTPRNVEISAEERARLIEKGFFNQS